MYIDTVRTAEAVVDVRPCWLGWRAVVRVLIQCGRARNGRGGRAQVLVLESAQARIGEICCSPEQQDHRHRLSEPAVAPPSHHHTIAEPSAGRARGGRIEALRGYSGHRRFPMLSISPFTAGRLIERQPAFRSWLCWPRFSRAQPLHWRKTRSRRPPTCIRRCSRRNARLVCV